MIQYHHFKDLLEAGAIISFEDFFLFLSPKQFCADTGISATRLRALRQLPRQMTLEEIILISTLLNVDTGKLGSIIWKGAIVREQ